MGNCSELMNNSWIKHVTFERFLPNNSIVLIMQIIDY